MISFRSGKALKHLLTNGFVFTIRKRRRRTGVDWMKVNGRKIYVDIKYVGRVVGAKVLTDRGEVDLSEYVKHSGFESVEEWLKEAKRLNRSEDLYLYRVDVIVSPEHHKILDLLDKLIFIVHREKCLEGDRDRTFIFIIYPTEPVPMLFVAVDISCAVCGESLTAEEGRKKCYRCGREFDGLHNVCPNGHFICNDCYMKMIVEVMANIYELIVANYEALKEMKRDWMNWLKDKPVKDKDKIAVRNSIYKILFKANLAKAVITNVYFLDPARFLFQCSKCQKCEGIKEIMEVLGWKV